MAPIDGLAHFGLKMDMGPGLGSKPKREAFRGLKA